ncbi:L,D-transpeptidase family protein [Allopontixanthobacter sp.]|uniref:L,D-transpeptidase family protein n=1 Tax=Allopontixanthobacter sp. TaxID=2906452 RepID=UPI002ABA5D36|nr:L,D-transpeptidase family protein [Allopontixanthobacter sp.]MDZ4308296.1 L,D-transpeptidase family protein [Allopontixanthobacter sp.]
MRGIAEKLFGALKLVIPILAAGALLAIAVPAPAAAQKQALSVLEREIASESDDLRLFYAARNFRPLWLEEKGQANPAVGVLLDRLDTAQFDGLDRKTARKLRTKDLRRDLKRAAKGDAEDIAAAEIEASRLFAQYVRATRNLPVPDMIWETKALGPAVPTPAYALQAASSADSLEDYVARMGWMHPLYAPLRDAMDTRDYSAQQRRVIWENLARIRALPAHSDGRYVLVDAAGSTLWMYENGEAVDSMRVVVGKPEMPTPMMAGFIRHAIVNPYWNIPPDLVQQNIATNVVDLGVGYLKDRGYEVLSDYGEKPARLDPRKINWHAVAAGAQTVRVRQKPGGSNFMGKVKFEFPNAQGIYLHDTPDRQLLKADQRQLSSGCVRVEDADRLGRWLLGKALPRPGKRAEQRIELPEIVPVYITYITAMPTSDGIAFRSDIYGLDAGAQLAMAD